MYVCIYRNKNMLSNDQWLSLYEIQYVNALQDTLFICLLLSLHSFFIFINVWYLRRTQSANKNTSQIAKTSIFKQQINCYHFSVIKIETHENINAVQDADKSWKEIHWKKNWPITPMFSFCVVQEIYDHSNINWMQ